MTGKAAAAQVLATWTAAAVTVLARVQRVGDTADINEGYIPLRRHRRGCCRPRTSRIRAWR